jgi:hypothetical protein
LSGPKDEPYGARPTLTFEAATGHVKELLEMRSKLLIGITGSAVIALLAAAPGWAEDTLRIRQLESEVQRLQREVDAQARRIDQLEQRAGTPGVPLATTPPVTARQSSEGSPAWLLSTNWDRIKPGMKDVDVIALLGRPTTVRRDPDGKGHALMYALEIGPNAVLAGNVRVTETGVAEVTKPTLR